MNEAQPILATLCLPVRNGKVVLYEKIHKVGAGCRNGLGGWKNEEETIIQAALRELREESGFVGNPAAMEYVADLTFNNESKNFRMRMFTFILTEWTEGEPTGEVKEMTDPRWYDFDELPLDQMMPADPLWLPGVLAGIKYTGEFFYETGPEKTGPKQVELLAYELLPVSSLQLPE